MKNMLHTVHHFTLFFAPIQLCARKGPSRNLIASSLIVGLGIVSILVIISSSVSIAGKVKERPVENGVLSVVQEMVSAFRRVEDYTCDVETIYYQRWQNESGYERYRFKFYFKRMKKIRVDFSQPYPGSTVIYSEGNEEATVIPFRFLPGLNLHISLKNPMLTTPTEQRLDQTDMGYFIDFISRSLKEKDKKNGELSEDEERIILFIRALDYLHGEKMEKYRIVISKKNWLPTRIERYELDGTPVESIQIKNYAINTHLDDHLFRPWE
jgi:outer membrane lipoprotein-sorting protein